MQPGQDHPGSPPHTGHHLAPALPWPARSAQLLEASFQLCTERLRDPLRASVNQFAQQLFDRADRAHNPFEQQRLMNCREQMAQQLNPLVLRCFDEIRQHFERLGLPPASAPEATGNSWHELTLVDPAEQELATTLDQIGSRGESQQLEALHDLGYRLAVLVAAPPLEGETLPVSPQVLIRAFHAATLPLQLPLDEQVQLLRSADRNLIRALAPIYAAVNAALREAGILRQLRSVPFLRHAATRPQLPAAAATEPQAAPGLPEPGPQAPPMAHASAPIEVLESLRDLLAQRRAAELRGAGGPANVATHAASTEELQGALGALQQHLAQVTDRASRELRSAARLHEELVTQLNAGKSADAPRTQLTSEQGDTVELVATLFEQLANQLHRGGTAKSLLGGLQLPVLRMAVADQGFFEHHSHPARQLLDTVATAADEWLDGTDDDANRLLASKLEQLVTRASDEPPSSSLYAVLLADIEQQVAQLKRKAEAAERRHVEAAEGRERLDQARQRARELMTARFADTPPRGLLRALLDRAWSDVLAITLLRHGEDSDAFSVQLAITDQLLGRLPIKNRKQLQRDVEAGLQQIGMHTEEALQVAQRLLGAPEDKAATAGQPSTPDLAQRLRQRQRLGESASVDAAVVPLFATAANEPAMPHEAKIGERLRGLPFGTWLEFDGAAGEAPTRRKLAWYSPMSGRCLLLNRRGQRAGDTTLNELAHEIARGRVREVATERESLLDRAWRSLTTLLRQAPEAVQDAGEAVRR
jgi:hypothetical protein